MTAILSSTYDDLYLFYLPITVWSWNKIGCECIVFMPSLSLSGIDNKKLDLLVDVKWELNLNFSWTPFRAPKSKEATYAQCSRLYAAALKWSPDDEILITGDIDMAVFNSEYFQYDGDSGQPVIYGADLVPEKQYPICYISMPAKTWREVMWVRDGETVQNKLDQLLGHIECDHFRGNMWAKDQETIYNHIQATLSPIQRKYRAAPGTQFATRRADRDGWPQAFSPDLIDAHLPRPGYTDENFLKILNLFQSMYPNEDFQWMIDYRNEYMKLIS